MAMRPRLGIVSAEAEAAVQAAAVQAFADGLQAGLDRHDAEILNQQFAADVVWGSPIEILMPSVWPKANRGNARLSLGPSCDQIRPMQLMTSEVLTVALVFLLAGLVRSGRHGAPHGCDGRARARDIAGASGRIRCSSVSGHERLAVSLGRTLARSRAQDMADAGGDLSNHVGERRPDDWPRRGAGRDLVGDSPRSLCRDRVRQDARFRSKGARSLAISNGRSGDGSRHRRDWGVRHSRSSLSAGSGT